MMTLNINGVDLNQDQLNAIIPVIVGHMSTRPLSQDELEQECLKAMAANGCPLEDSTSG